MRGLQGDGEALLMGCWYMGAFLPLLTFSHRVVNGWGFYLVADPVLLLARSFSAVSDTRKNGGIRFGQGSMSIGTWAGGCWR